MRSRVRPPIIAFAAALLISVLAPFASGVSRGARPSGLLIVSPPPEVGLPIGQYVGVRYRFTGVTPAILELAADGVVLIRDQARPGQEVTHAWSPTKPGPHRLHVRVLGPGKTVLDGATLTVIGLSAGSRVQVPPLFVYSAPSKALK